MSDDIDKKVAAASKKGESIQSVWRSMLQACPNAVRQELEMPEWAEVKRRLQQMSEVSLHKTLTKEKTKLVMQMKKMIDVWSSIECANSRITCFNPVLTTLLRCNTAPVLLGSRESSRGACFYLVKYLTKDSVALTLSLIHI